MISDFKQIEELFKEVDQRLNIKIQIYIIGGAVLLYQGLKSSTKDIDIILSDKDTYNSLQKTLLLLGFSEKKPTEEYKKMEINNILEKEDFRFDIFLKKVCKKIMLTDEMKHRASQILKMKNLTIYLCSNEDILIFKSITERKGDLEDCIVLAKRGINWQIVLKEIRSQIKQSGEDIWITWIGERLDILENEGINIPIIKEIDKLRDNYFEQIEKKSNIKK